LRPSSPSIGYTFSGLKIQATIRLHTPYSVPDPFHHQCRRHRDSPTGSGSANLLRCYDNPHGHRRWHKGVLLQYGHKRGSVHSHYRKNSQSRPGRSRHAKCRALGRRRKRRAFAKLGIPSYKRVRYRSERFHKRLHFCAIDQSVGFNPRLREIRISFNPGFAVLVRWYSVADRTLFDFLRASGQ
jgi:hypothetical protein